MFVFRNIKIVYIFKLSFATIKEQEEKGKCIKMIASY